MIIASDGTRITPAATISMWQDIFPKNILEQLHQIESETGLHAWETATTACKFFPCEFRKEALAQAARKLKKLKITDESIRNEIHEQIVIQSSWSPYKAIRKSGIAPSALDVRGSKVDDEKWTELTPRQRRRQKRRALAAVDLHAGFVGGDSGNKRCSRTIRMLHEIELKKQDEFRSKAVVINNATGDTFGLPTATEARKARLSEMYTIALGIQKQIEAGKLGWLSAVATALARMHPNPRFGKNTWDGTLPHEVIAWFSERWALFRSRLAKKDIPIAGLWTREAHQDGCPHSNYLLAYPPEHEEKIIEILYELFGHSETALKITIGGKTKGETPATFASYAYKYFVKNLNDGWGVDVDCDSEEATATAFGYRRFGFFGIPALSTWRELRRLKTPPTDPTLLRAWEAAHGKNTEDGKPCASTWIEVAGGLACRRKHRPIQPLRLVRMHLQHVCGDTPFEGKEVMAPRLDPQTGRALTEVVGVRVVVTTPLGQVDTAVVQTRTPGTFSIHLDEQKTQNQNQNQEQKQKVTLIYNYPSERAAPSPKPPKIPSCTEREYRLAKG
jgi:hypothetical protein